ncbi:serine-type peptidase [Pseudohyphozyma bogoriensis]|nr:serine-type peptidase [Pseudohyphozyma bogoriensis]
MRRSLLQAKWGLRLPPSSSPSPAPAALLPPAVNSARRRAQAHHLANTWPTLSPTSSDHLVLLSLLSTLPPISSPTTSTHALRHSPRHALEKELDMWHPALAKAHATLSDTSIVEQPTHTYRGRLVRIVAHAMRLLLVLGQYKAAHDLERSFFSTDRLPKAEGKQRETFRNRWAFGDGVGIQRRGVRLAWMQSLVLRSGRPKARTGADTYRDLDEFKRLVAQMREDQAQAGGEGEVMEETMVAFLVRRAEEIIATTSTHAQLDDTRGPTLRAELDDFLLGLRLARQSTDTLERGVVGLALTETSLLACEDADTPPTPELDTSMRKLLSELDHSDPLSADFEPETDVSRRATILHLVTRYLLLPSPSSSQPPPYATAALLYTTLLSLLQIPSLTKYYRAQISYRQKSTLIRLLRSLFSAAPSPAPTRLPNLQDLELIHQLMGWTLDALEDKGTGLMTGISQKYFKTLLMALSLPFAPMQPFSDSHSPDTPLLGVEGVGLTDEETKKLLDEAHWPNSEANERERRKAALKQQRDERTKERATGADAGVAAPAPSPSPLVVDDLLQLPRPGAAIPNPSGTLALWPSSQFEFETNRTAKTLALVFLDDGKAEARPRVSLTGLASLEAGWLDDDTFLFVRLGIEDELSADAKKEGSARMDHPLGVSDVKQKERVKAHKAKDESVELWAKAAIDGTEYIVGRLPVAPENVGIRLSPSGGVASLVFSAEVYPDGRLDKVAEHDKKAEEDQKGSDGQVYDSVFVRHWDTWSTTVGKKQQVHFVTLSKTPEAPESDDGFEHVEWPDKETDQGRWRIVTDKVKSKDGEGEGASATTKKPVIHSPLAGTPLECPVGPFGGSGDFDVSSEYLVFHAKDPHVNQAWHTRTNVYLVPLSPKSDTAAKPKLLSVGNQGASSSPVFSPDGKRIAWLEMREDGYEADKNRLVVYEVEEGKRWNALEEWDRSPSEVTWSPSGDAVFLQAEDKGHVKVFTLPLPVPSSSATYVETEPLALTHKHSVSSVSALSPTQLLLTASSLTSPNQLSLLSVPSDPHEPAKHTPLSSFTPSLHQTTYLDPGETFSFPGANGVEVYGWIHFPPGAKGGEEKKWPLAFLIHGGPQGAWTDSWSTRWNPNIFVSAGYITVAVNPTGSTGYGQEFCDAIKNQWGGLPFQDLVAGLNFVKTTYPEIDPERTAALGASYGGYMCNWIQGHNDQMGFKAIVCHDGVFSTDGTWYETEELYFPEREFGGTPWAVPENYRRWNPQNHIHNWKTPQLVIHSSKDFRLTVSQGLGVFNTLQRLGVPSRFLHFPEENHWVLKPANSRRWTEEVLRWIDEWTSVESVAGVTSQGEVDAIEPEVKSGYNPGYVA